MIRLRGVLGIPRGSLVTSVPAAVVCQAPAKWERSSLDSVGSDHSHSLLHHSDSLGWKATEGWAFIKNYSWEKGLLKWKATTKKKHNGTIEIMSSEQESYTPNICHQMQGTTIYVVPLLHPVIPPNWPTETAAVSWGLQISWNNTPFLCQRLCCLVHEAQVVFFQRNDMHVSPDKATSKHSRARNELLSTLLSPQNCILTITTVFTNDKTPNLNSYFRGNSYWCYWEFLLKRVPCLPRVPIFPTPRLFHSCGCCAALTYGSFSIRHIPQNYLSLLVTNQSMGCSAPVRRGCWGKNGKCD